MNFEELERDLDMQDETISHCAEALRVRGRKLKEPALMAAADWLESEDGRGAILDLTLGETLEPGGTDR